MKLIHLTIRSSFYTASFNASAIQAIVDMGTCTAVFVNGEEFHVIEKYDEVLRAWIANTKPE